MPAPGSGSTLAHIARQKGVIAKTALQLGITNQPVGGPMKRVVPAQAAKTDPTVDESMFASVKSFLESLSGYGRE